MCNISSIDIHESKYMKSNSDIISDISIDKSIQTIQYHGYKIPSSFIELCEISCECKKSRNNDTQKKEKCHSYTCTIIPKGKYHCIKYLSISKSNNKTIATIKYINTSINERKCCNPIEPIYSTISLSN
jgi:hypothetical protein